MWHMLIKIFKFKYIYGISSSQLFIFVFLSEVCIKYNWFGLNFIWWSKLVWVWFTAYVLAVFKYM